MRRKVTAQRGSAPAGLRAFWAYARRETAQSEPVQLAVMRRRLARLALRAPRQGAGPVGPLARQVRTSFS